MPRVRLKFLLPRQFAWGATYTVFNRTLEIYPLPGIGVAVAFGRLDEAADAPAPLTWGDVADHYGMYQPRTRRTEGGTSRFHRWKLGMSIQPQDVPELRSLQSLTKEEAVKLVEFTTGRGVFIGDPEELRKGFFEMQVVKVTRLQAAMLLPQGLNFLLQRGFNLFGIPHVEAPAPKPEEGK